MQIPPPLAHNTNIMPADNHQWKPSNVGRFKLNVDALWPTQAAMLKVFYAIMKDRSNWNSLKHSLIHPL